MGMIHYVKSHDGVKLAVHDLGGSGPPLLLLHANGLLGRCYLPIAEALASDFHCWALDIRGHGESAHAGLHPVVGASMGRGAQRLPRDHAPIWRQLDTLVDDVLECAAWLADRCGPAPLYGFGHSLGGTLALAAEERRSGTFAALYTFEAVMYGSDSPEPAPEMLQMAEMLSMLALKRRSRFSSKAAALESYAGKLPFSGFDRRALELYVEHGLRRLPKGDVTLVCKPHPVEAWVYFMIEPLSEQTFRQLPSIACPVTVACGTGGQPTDFLQDMVPPAAAQLTNGRLDRLEGLHHFGPLERPQLLADRMLEAFRAAAARPQIGTGRSCSNSLRRSKL